MIRKKQVHKLEKTKNKPKTVSDAEFDELLRVFLVEKAPMLKRLSKK
jgi:hypothetical protein